MTDYKINDYDDIEFPPTEIEELDKFIIDTIEKNSKSVIDGFILKGYNKTNGLYRKNIILKNENFFLKNSFDDVLGGKPDFVDRIFQFKNFWSKLKSENKEILKYYLITLCCYADKRYINFNKYLLIKKFNEENFKLTFEKFDHLI